MRTSNALVTGSSGFIGRHLVRALRRRGFGVVELDTNGRPPAFSDSDALAYFRNSTVRYDLVFHCAANVGGRQAIDHRRSWQMENFALDAAYMQFIERTKPGVAVYFSSSAAYPTYLQTDQYAGYRLSEDYIDVNPAAPDAIYGLAKLIGERLVDETEFDRIVVVRPFSGYGEDQSLDYPFPTYVKRAAMHANPFNVWGSPESTRDWIHVDDVVGALFALIDTGVFKCPVNLCTGRATSFQELAQLCMDAAGYQAPIRSVESMPQGCMHRVGDPSVLHNFYTPHIDIETGVDVAIWRSFR